MPFFAYASPVGPLEIIEETGAIVGIRFASGGPPRENASRDSFAPKTALYAETPLLAKTARELERYFAGSLERFTIPLAPRGTPFQLAVWKALLAIPYGTISTYGEVARAAGNPLAARAVGMACNRNPIAIAIPCHRVVGASGALTGYAGGVDVKRFLIDLEARRQPHLL
jgi:methylated-DNA-[protein]-cysteine S-methyltransferase